MSQPLLFPDAEVTKDAVLSDDQLYRYRLSRVWDRHGLICNFVMMNPSTADAEDDDPTIKKCVAFARRWGHGGIVVTNLFAWRATDPDVLSGVAQPIGPDNDRHIREAANLADFVVCAWGAHPTCVERGMVVRHLLGMTRHFPHAIRLTKDRHPGHPLFLPGKLDPIPWET